jgi:membrane protease YdiL (CAAX protease family)
MLPTPTGWFPDPWNPDGVRYWDGRQWTGLTALRAADARRPRRREPISTLPDKAAWGAVITLIGSLIGGRYVLKAIAGFEWPIVVYFVILAAIAYVPAMVWCVHASKEWGTGRFRTDTGLTARPSDFGWGPLTWLAAMVSNTVVVAIVIGLDIPYTSNLEKVSDIKADRAYIIASLVTAVVVAPIVEEIVFRGVVLRGLLSRYPGPVAVGIQGVLFGLAHFDPVRGAGNIGLIMVLSSVGCVFGGAALLLRRITPTIIAHGIVNTIAMIIALTGLLDT